MRKPALLLISVLSLMAASFAQERCGSQGDGKKCGDCRCCSRWGYCGSTADYCGGGCQSNCWGCGLASAPGVGNISLASTPGVGNIGSIVTESLFEEMLKHRNDNACPGKGFYTYEAFISAANSFPAFGNTEDIDTRKREIAAFLAQTSHEPTDALARCGMVSFESALWFWMTPQPPKPSCHDVITNQWIPSDIDKNKGRIPGYGVITNIINGGLECGHGNYESVANRTGFYKRNCDLMGVHPGDNLDCYNQRPFNEQVIASATAV